MFDMNKSADRRLVLTVLGIFLGLSCVPALLVWVTRTAERAFASILIGVVLYYGFLRKK